MRLRYISLFFLSIVSAAFVSAQSTAEFFTSELNIKFDALEIKKLDRAAKLVSDGEALMQEAQRMFESLSEVDKNDRFCSNYQAAIKKLYQSSETTHSAYETAYLVFHYKNQAFWQKMSRNNHRASGMEKAKYYEGTGTRSYNRSIIRRKQVTESDRFEYSYEIMQDALEHEKMAVRDRGRALQICTDYPVEYNYGWADDKSLEEIVKIMKDPIVHEPPKDIFATVNENAVVDSSLLKDVIFKVQIMAHTQPLSQEYLDLFYRGSLPIDLIYEENWYKYSIGIYRTFEEAEATREELNIKKAFVVAYCEGKKISTREAISLVEKKKMAGN